jgi:hypothetical protein
LLRDGFNSQLGRVRTHKICRITSSPSLLWLKMVERYFMHPKYDSCNIPVTVLCCSFCFLVWASIFALPTISIYFSYTRAYKGIRHLNNTQQTLNRQCIPNKCPLNSSKSSFSHSGHFTFIHAPFTFHPPPSSPKCDWYFFTLSQNCPIHR